MLPDPLAGPPRHGHRRLAADRADAGSGRGAAQAGVKAAYLNSTLDYARADAIEARVAAGGLDILYVSPERLLQERTLGLLARTEMSLFAIDEAHCVSQWGHDFRPEYRQLKVLAERFPGMPRIALTATADERTREEIVAELRLGNAERFVASFDRPNIRYTIAEMGSMSARERLWQFIEEEHAEDAGIVYCLSRRSVEETAAWLNGKGRKALAYHAGLDAEVRRSVQERFLNDNGVIVVATIAFGMGIDKPDVRFVAHLNLPKSIEAYYQETGRAGRDGKAANAWMAYGLQDLIQLRQWIGQSEGAEAYKQVQRQKLDALIGLASCRAAGGRRCSRTSASGGAAVRQLRQLHQPAGDDRRHGAGAEGAVGRLSHRTTLRRHVCRRRADGARQRPRRPHRPRQAAGVRHRQGYGRGDVEGRLPPAGRRRASHRRR